MEKEKSVYEVVITGTDRIISQMVLAEGTENAKMIVIAANSADIKPDSQVLCRPFCS